MKANKLQFKKNPPKYQTQVRNNHRVVAVEENIYQEVEAIAKAENCTLKEATSRLIEAGVKTYKNEKAPKY